jgi:hypothetical protein
MTQLQKYAGQFVKEGCFSGNTKFKIMLIGAEMGASIRNRLGKYPNDYFRLESLADDKVKTYAILWSDLLEMSRRRLSYLSQEIKSRDRTIQAFFAEDFSEINIKNIEDARKKM